MPPLVFFFKEKTNAAISATTPSTLSDQEVRLNVERWGPFNSLDFKNGSIVAVHVFLDGNPDRRFKVEAGQGLNIDPRENVWYRDFTVLRDSAVAIAADELRAQFQRINVT